MTATADKARYFLEQSVPELKEWERKKIFSSDEIASISRRRSDFEHKINARGSAPHDYIQYAEFEINVDALRKKRVKRLGVKTTAHSGQRRVFFVFDRGTRKFPGDIGLWMQSIEYCRHQTAYKKLSQVLTNALRLHPTNPDLWIYAASCAIDEKGDMTEARSYMQRGLRFCKNKRQMWLEFARLELAYMAKIHARRQVLGIGQPAVISNKSAAEDETDDIMHLPRLTANDIMPDAARDKEVDEVALRNLDKTPIMTGAIPIAIFDSAMLHFRKEATFAHQFFDMAAEFGDVPAAHLVLTHVLTNMKQTADSDWHTLACDIAMPLIGKIPNTAEYVSALRQSLSHMTQSLSSTRDEASLTQWCQSWLQKQLRQEHDSAVELILKSKLKSVS